MYTSCLSVAVVNHSRVTAIPAVATVTAVATPPTIITLQSTTTSAALYASATKAC